MMNTKCKSRIVDAVGRPVCTLPVDPRVKAERRILGKLPEKVINVNEQRKPVKEGRSTSASKSAGSKRSAQSVRSRSGSGSRTKSTGKSPVSNISFEKSCESDISYYGSDTEDQGQDVKFVDVPKSRPTSAWSKPLSKKTIDPQEILEINKETDVNKIYEIIQHGENITAISHLEKFQRLKILDLSCNHIEKISNLHNNLDLRDLKLYDNKITVIENLDSLKDLSSLQVQHNRIKSLGKGLTQLKKLKTLRLDSNLILKLEPADISGCVHLTSLDISFNLIDNISALNYLPNLEELSASGNRLQKISDLSRCHRLVEVDLSNNKITDVTGLKKLHNLQILKLSNNHISSFSAFGKMKSVEELDVSSNRLAELSPLSTVLPSLQILNVCDNLIKSWNEVISLSQIEGLVELFISGNPFGADDGEYPHYFAELQKSLPNLEILDGAHVKKVTGKPTAPIMRPMSASTVVSVRQMDNQMKAINMQISDLKDSITKKFQSLRETCQSLPDEAPPPLSGRNPQSSSPVTEPESRPSSRRLKIQEALDFAASQKFD